MLHNQKYPRLDCHGFLERAFIWLKLGQDNELFYAALELRFTFEKLMIKHGNVSTNYSRDFLKSNWKPKKLRNRLIDEFKSRLDLKKAYKFTLDPTRDASTMGYYLPISDDLFVFYGQLNNYLHAQWAINMFSPTSDWYKDTYTFLSGFADKLIPHASPENSLDYLSIPNIQIEEMEFQQLEQILRDTLPRIQG